MCTCVHADDLDEDGTVLTASPEPQSSKGGTPDLLADSPPKQPDAPSPNASRVTPRVLFPALFLPPTPTCPRTPSTQAPTSPTAAAGLPHHPQEQATETSFHSTDCSSPRGVSSERRMSGDQEQEPAPVGCYSTLAAHHRVEPSGIGHELPACFASPPTAPPQTSRSRHTEEPMDTISLADAPLAVSHSAHIAAPKVTLIGAVKHTDVERPGDAEDDCSASATSEKTSGIGSAKAAGTPMAGLRDLFGPMGGLFKGAFSQPASGTSADGERREGRQAQESTHAAMAGQVGLNGEAAEAAQSEQPGNAGPAPELTQALIAALPRKGPSSHGSAVKLPKVTRLAGGSSISSTSKDLTGSSAEAGPSASAVDPGSKSSTLPVLSAHPEPTQSKEQPSSGVSFGSSQEPGSAGCLLAADEPAAHDSSMDTEQPDSVALGQSRTGERAAGSASSNGQDVRISVDVGLHSTAYLQDAAATGDEDLHTDAPEHEAHALSNSGLGHSKDDQEASATASVQAPTAPSSHAHDHHSELPAAELLESGDGISGSMQGGSSHESGPAQHPFRGRHRRCLASPPPSCSLQPLLKLSATYACIPSIVILPCAWQEFRHCGVQSLSCYWAYRWADSDAVLMPRGESEEETLVGSFTKLLVGAF